MNYKGWLLYKITICVFFLVIFPFNSYIKKGAIVDPVIFDASIFDLQQYQTEISSNKKVDGSVANPTPGSSGANMTPWIIAMDLLSALQVVALDIISSHEGLSGGNANPAIKKLTPQWKNPRPRSLPPPLATHGTYNSLLFGVPTKKQTSSKIRNNEGGSLDDSIWNFNPIYCRTTFESSTSPSSSKLNVLEKHQQYQSLVDIVVAGSVGEDLDLMLPRGPLHYNQGWTLDVKKAHKTLQRNYDRQHSVRNVDGDRTYHLLHHKAYYGIAASGLLTLFLPFQGYETFDINKNIHAVRRNRQLGNKMEKVLIKANDMFRTVVVCELINERLGGTEDCRLSRDVSFIAGGANITKTRPVPVTDHGTQHVCIAFDVPDDASLTTRENVEQADHEEGNKRLLVASTNERLREDETLQSVTATDTNIGMALEIYVSNPFISWKDGPCSVSHVVWETSFS